MDLIAHTDVCIYIHKQRKALSLSNVLLFVCVSLLFLQIAIVYTLNVNPRV